MNVANPHTPGKLPTLKEAKAKYAAASALHFELKIKIMLLEHDLNLLAMDKSRAEDNMKAVMKDRHEKED